MWELRFRRDQFSIDSAIAKGRALPDWYLDEPDCWPEDAFYMQWFWRLSTERQIGQFVGPIPYTRIEERARRSALGGDEALEELFCLVMEGLDSAFLEWMRSEHSRHVRMNTSRSKAGPSKTEGATRPRRKGQR